MSISPELRKRLEKRQEERKRTGERPKTVAKQLWNRETMVEREKFFRALRDRL